MKIIVITFLITFSINAQENDNFLNKNGYDEFDSPKFENKQIDSFSPKPPTILQSSGSNSKPEFVSAASASTYEDSAFLFNVLTNHPDGKSVNVMDGGGVPSWLKITNTTGGKMTDITRYPYASNQLATETPIDYVTDIEFDSDGNLYYVDYALFTVRKIGSDGKVTDFAGSHQRGGSGPGPATSARMNAPTDIAFDSQGNMYVVEMSGNIVRKVDTNGTIKTIAGTGEAGFSGDGGAATSAKLNSPYGVDVDDIGNVYIADTGNHVIRKVNINGNISTIVGTAQTNGYSGDNGAATSAKLWSPLRVQFTKIAGADSLFIVDMGNHAIRNVGIQTGTIWTVVGTGVAGFSGDGGAAASAKLKNPYGFHVVENKDNGDLGTMYIADFGNHVIRKYNHGGDKKISTIAGSPSSADYSGDDGAAYSAKLSYPENVTFYNNELYISDSGNDRIRKVSNMSSSDSDLRLISTTAGGTSATELNNDMLASTSLAGLARNPVFDKYGNLYYADQRNHMIRAIVMQPNANASLKGKIVNVVGKGSQGFSGDGGIYTEAELSEPRAVAFDDANNMYISDRGNKRIRKVNVTTGIITTFAGTGESGYSGDGGPATEAKITFSYQLEFRDGSLYFADSDNHVIRKIDSNGIITTIAGNNTKGYSGDGGAATSAQFSGPLGVDFDSNGNLFIADYGNHVIRKLDTNGNISTVAGTGTRGYSGDGGAATSATLDYPAVLTIDKSDNIYIADSGNDIIRKIWKSGIITTIAGTGAEGYLPPTTGTATTLSAPFGVVLDSVQNLYITDSWNFMIRKLDAAYHTLSGIPTNSDVGTKTFGLYADVSSGANTTQEFTLEVINVNDAPEIASIDNQTVKEDSDLKAIKIVATDVDSQTLTYSAYSDTSGLKLTVSNDTIYIKPATDYFGVAKVTAMASDGKLTDSLTFNYTVTNIQDKPTPFDWLSIVSDTLNLTKDNLLNFTYQFKWSESKDMDNEQVKYLLYAKIGLTPWEHINEGILLDSTNLVIRYQEFLEGAFENFPTVSAATVRFTISATDNIDTVKVSNSDRILFINRYQYLSTLDDQIPATFALHENYPNPFNPTTTLRFDLPEVSDVNVVIYNMLGQKVRTFNMNSISAGSHSIKWNATNDLGDPVGAGVYLYQLQAKDFMKTRKMILLK